MLELGAGVGLVGMYGGGAGLARHACLTDLPAVLPILRRNLAANPALLLESAASDSEKSGGGSSSSSSRVSVRALAWGTDDWRRFVRGADIEEDDKG